jgi:8-oxo-dGTP pyrophosphatase MutT (NUDIX family)
MVRPSEDAFEVFMVRRHIKSDFASDVYVFPGGKVDDADAAGALAIELKRRPNASATEPACGWSALYLAAVRELFEESGVLLARTADLTLFSNWVTPRTLSKRFDTYFFLAKKPLGQEARHADLHELTDSLWITPEAALERYRNDLFPLVYATLRHLHQLAGFESIDALFAFAETNDLTPVHPLPVMRNGCQEFLIPGDSGYDEALNRVDAL